MYHTGCYTFQEMYLRQFRINLNPTETCNPTVQHLWNAYRIALSTALNACRPRHIRDHNRVTRSVRCKRSDATIPENQLNILKYYNKNISIYKGCRPIKCDLPKITQLKWPWA